jgi:outer membrane protein OmpA-like peptidoglycan-associated protein
MKYMLILILFINFYCYSNTNNYQSNFKESKWIVNNSKLYCEIEHTIKNFGVAKFRKNAGDRLYSFNFDFFYSPKTITQANVYLIPNHWQTLPVNYQLFNVDVFNGFDIYFKNKEVDLLFNFLEQGYKIGFIYTDNFRTNFILNQINFHQSYTKFISCVHNLLPFSFLDIKNTTLNFESNSFALTKQSEKNLDKLLKYLNEDENIKSIKINSYSDSYGGKDKNMVISKERRKFIIQKIILLGFNSKIFSGKSFGERHFVSNNDTLQSRLKNRRITISIYK